MLWFYKPLNNCWLNRGERPVRRKFEENSALFILFGSSQVVNQEADGSGPVTTGGWDSPTVHGSGEWEDADGYTQRS